MSVPPDRIVLSNNKERWSEMTYTITLETFNGSTKKINLASKGAVAKFVMEYPQQLPVGISVKMSCDALGLRGTMRGKAVLNNG
jgi:hypothetical protein